MLLSLAAATSGLLPANSVCRRTALGFASVVCSPLPSYAASPRLTGPRVATPRNVPFVLIGAGGVGSALLKTITDSRAFHADRYGIRLSALAVCDSSAAHKELVQMCGGTDTVFNVLSKACKARTCG